MENTLLKKLQIKTGFRLKVLNAPAPIEEILGNISGQVLLVDELKNLNAILIFTRTKQELLDTLNLIHKAIDEKLVCWILYPKAKSKIATDLNLMQSWDDLKSYQLHPCASAAIDDTWTALRIKPESAMKKSGLGNAEIQTNDYSQYVNVESKIITLPEDLKLALQQSPNALHFYEQLSYSNRKEYVLWILTAKQEKTRLDRIQKAVEKLLTGKKNPSEK